MNNIYGEDSGKGFIKEVPLSTFAKAIESAIYKAPLRENNKVWLSDLWFITSLPEDLIKEAISKYIEEIDLPQDVEEIYDDEKNKVLWKK
jgi:hypothetical protein